MQQQHFESQIAQTYNVYVNPYGMRRLTPTFRPGSFDVLCARGKVAFDHEGNRRFRSLVKQHQKQYSSASCKYEKSKIVSFIVSAVRTASPQGGFVKNIDGVWHEVGDRHAKEKVGQTFRDLLHNKYSSSTKAKARARMQRRVHDGTSMGNDSRDKDDQQQKATTKPQRVTSRSSARADAIRSSASVVSEGSMEDGVTSNASTVRMDNLGVPPPLVSVKVHTSNHLGQVSPNPAPRCTQSVNLMETLRSSVHTFDGRDSSNTMRPSTHTGSGHLPGAPDNRDTMMQTDLEPLPLEATSSVKVDFNDSSSTMQSEQSFDDAMDDFYKHMRVAV